MSFFTERSIYWRPDALMPAPIFLQDTLDLGTTESGCFKKQMLRQAGHYVF